MARVTPLARPGTRSATGAGRRAGTPRLPPARARRGERGHALLLVALLGLLAMGLWGVSWRATHDAIRVERVVRLRDERTRFVLPALAAGLARLRGGHPPGDPYACVATVADGTESWDCALLFESEGNADTWRVSVRRADASEAATLPALPEAFSDP